MSDNKLTTNNLYVFKLLEERYRLNREQIVLTAKRNKYYRSNDIISYESCVSKLQTIASRKRELNKLLHILGY